MMEAVTIKSTGAQKAANVSIGAIVNLFSNHLLTVHTGIQAATTLLLSFVTTCKVHNIQKVSL